MRPCAWGRLPGTREQLLVQLMACVWETILHLADFVHEEEGAGRGITASYGPDYGPEGLLGVVATTTVDVC